MMPCSLSGLSSSFVLRIAVLMGVPAFIEPTGLQLSRQNPDIKKPVDIQ
jgi:hypothetical protein